ncbi:MAG: hypothetical protein K2J18_03945 [Paramuribaculum sp.]|nr:hypothetical protein [Bacteroides sp.]MDE6825898.1 hypothetical protein [Paramuribaculum sp.]MDE7471938.1 hypothetical protein [Paramuribaculum sp.]
MITKKVIESIYKQYKKKPDSPFDLEIGLLFSPEMDKHCINIDGDNIIIGSISPDSPFHTIALDRIHAIIQFDRVIAIVLPASIIFLQKNSQAVNIHIKMDAPSLIDKIRYKFSHPD